jgi:hypothetical protein
MLQEGDKTRQDTRVDMSECGLCAPHLPQAVDELPWILVLHEESQCDLHLLGLLGVKEPSRGGQGGQAGRPRNKQVVTSESKGVERKKKQS